MMAAYNGHDWVVNLLIAKNGLDLNSIDNENYLTPLS